jgi:hypothetical protein
LKAGFLVNEATYFTSFFNSELIVNSVCDASVSCASDCTDFHGQQCNAVVWSKFKNIAEEAAALILYPVYGDSSLTWNYIPEGGNFH